MDITRRHLVTALIVVLAVAGLIFWFLERKRQAAELEVEIGSGKVISEAFKKARSLKVATLSGDVRASGKDPGWGGWFPTSTTVEYPYTADYFVDLYKVSPASFRWNAETRTMTVLIPEVTVAKPAIDAAKIRYRRNDGWIVTPGSVRRITTQVAQRAASIAANSAKKEEHMSRARESALEAVQALVSAPLREAKLGQVNVDVRFPWDNRGTGAPVRWDESRTPAEVLGN